MIGRLRGELVEIENSMAVVDVAGVGYEVQLPDAVIHMLPPVGEPVELLIRQIFREDGVSLYGFLLAFQRRLFDLLLSVKGCGPKVGLALIGQVGEETVASAILAQDAKILTRASGVGIRLAERIILELKDKIQEESFLRKVVTQTQAPKKKAPADELVEALLGLGYRRSEAEAAANDAREQATDVQDQIVVALRLLKK